ncbi:MAG: VWA domain-containing protein [Bacteroidota bacterium]
MTRKTSLPAHLIAFTQHLRKKGFVLGPNEEADALRALEILEPYRDQGQFKLALRSVLCRSLKDLLLFEELYDQYWRELAKAQDAKLKDVEEEKPQAKKANRPPSLQVIKDWLYGNQQTDEKKMAGYDGAVSRGQKDFGAFQEEGLQEIAKIIQLIARDLANQESRRYKASRRGDFDFRQTMRANLRRGGEVLHIRHRKKQKHALKLVLLCDVSKSMDLYSQFLVQFLYAFQNNYRHIDTFVFSSSLERITRQLQKRSFAEAMTELQDSVFNWSSGTKIGACFQTFYEDYASQLLDSRTVVLVLSDGWDTGEVHLLKSYLQKIHRKAAKVIWLNPLAGSLDFQPEVAGMKAAMPFIDVFALAYSVESLRAVVKQLRKRRSNKFR